MQAFLYNVGMSDYTQYTIRKVPKEVDARLKAQAKRRGLSLNKLVLDKLGGLPKLDTKPKVHHDLDFLIGSMSKAETEKLSRDIDGARQLARRQAQEEYEQEKARGEWG